MARLHYISDSDDSLPEVDALLTRREPSQNKQLRVGNLNKQGMMKPHRAEESRKMNGDEQIFVQLALGDARNMKEAVSPTKPQPGMQRPLGRATGNPLRHPLNSSGLKNGTIRTARHDQQQFPMRTDQTGQRQSFALPKTPKRASGKKINHSPAPDELSDFHDATDAFSWEYYDDSLSDFIVSDSASETELRLPPRSQRKDNHVIRGRKATRERRQVLSSDEDETSEDQGQRCKMNRPGRSQDEILSAIRKLSLGSSGDIGQRIQHDIRLNALSYKPTYNSSDATPPKTNQALECPPPTYLSPSNSTQDLEIKTPPTFSAEIDLQSSTKTFTRISLSPTLPYLDSSKVQEEVPDSDDQHFPSTLLTKPYRNSFIHRITDIDDIAKGSPLKPLCTISTKKHRAAMTAAKQAFDAEKDEIAQSLLVDLDEEITGGRLGLLCAHIGGIKIQWNKTLQTTAGRAKCSVHIPHDTPKNPTIIDGSTTLDSIALPTKPATIKRNTSIAYIYLPVLSATKTSLNPEKPTELSYVQEAKIILSTKVLTTKERLLKTLSHEFCHLAASLLSGSFKAAHGPYFKAWARLVEVRFGPSRGIKISTKHSYELEWKYIWRCIEHGHELHRARNTIDPKIHTCGKCRGRLEQIKPKPRAGNKGKAGKKADGVGKATTGSYQAFVRANFQRVKQEYPAWGFGEIAVEMGRRYRAGKKTAGVEVGMEVDEEGDRLLVEIEDED